MSTIGPQRTADTSCPECGTRISAATCLSDPSRKVAEGDFTICISCAALLMFTDALGNIRPATAEETTEFLQDDGHRMLIRKVYASVADRGREALA